MSNFCEKCGKPLEPNQQCDCTPATAQQPPYQQPQQAPYQQPQQAPYQQPQQAPYQQPQQYAAAPSDNRKIYSILSYVGILWLVGMFASPEKDDPKVRFHVGQGIILSIVYAGLWIVISILTGILGSIFTTDYGFGYFGSLYRGPAPFVGIISMLLFLALTAMFIYFLVVGIMNVQNDRQKQLPFIGKYSFYK